MTQDRKMTIAVCMKEAAGEINPFDECALECALKIKRAKVVVVSMGRLSAERILEPYTRLGAEVILLSDDAFAGSDTLATGYILSKAIMKIHPDYVFCGKQSIDGDTAQTGPGLAAQLGYACITNVMELTEIDRIHVLCRTRLYPCETVKAPAVLTIERINVLRFPRINSLVNKVKIWNHEDLNDLESGRCGFNGSPTEVVKCQKQERGKRSCKFIQFDQLEQVIKYQTKRRNYDIAEYKGERLEQAWCIGNEVVPIIRRIARHIHKIPVGDEKEILKEICAKEPSYVFWDTSLWSRRTAPVIAAKLLTGLCADCTGLKVRKGILYMERPACSGDLIATIKCRTKPVMATVRTVDLHAKGSVILGCGMGTASYYDQFVSFAKENHLEMAASRALVDSGIAPYEDQVGLTGKSVCPNIYFACGISGAIQHTVGMEESSTVIAINTDKDARIFEYADYGIIGDAVNLLNILSVPAKI